MNIPLLLLLFAVATFLVAYGIKKLQKEKVGESSPTRQPGHSPLFVESGNPLHLEQDEDNPEIQRLH
jgi:hypothetical protein